MTPTRLAVIDDDADLRKALCWMLRLDGFEVSDFGDAREAITQLEAGLPIDAILLDLMMPGMNGWDFCNYRATSPALQKIPVIVITARRGFEPPVGVAEVILKPFAPEKLHDAITRALAAQAP
jgi:CheY-like chemotaxis protein